MKILVLHNIFIEPAYAFSKYINCQIYKHNNYKAEHRDILIIFGAHNAAESLLKIKNEYDMNFIIIQSEQLNSQCFLIPFYKELLKNSLVFDWSYHNIHLLKENYDITCKYIFSWCFLKPQQVKFNIDFNSNKKFDIFFAGVRTIERENTISHLKQLNPNLKWFVDLDYRLTDYVKFTSVVSRCKYVINIPAYDGSALEMHRIIKALYCGCQVLSSYNIDKNLVTNMKEYIHFGNLNELITNIDNLEEKKNINCYIKNYEQPIMSKIITYIKEFKQDMEIQQAIEDQNEMID